MVMVYPESLLFPRLFPVTHNQAPVGAMPLPMMIAPWSGHKRKTGLGTFMEHIALRIRNPRLPHAQYQQYRAFLFSAKMNLQLCHHPLRMLMKRGPEELAPPKTTVGFNPDASSDFLSEDIGLKRRGRELAAMIRDHGMWSYFVTLTCNIAETPGVCNFIKRMDGFYGKDKRDRAYTSHLPMIIRLW
jgi:hypothetical protein